MFFLILREAKSDLIQIVSTCTKTVTEMFMFGPSLRFYLNSCFAKLYIEPNHYENTARYIFKKILFFLLVYHHIE